MRILTTVVALVGLALSSWVTVVKLAGLPCSAGCDHVLYSVYGSFNGVPITVLGIALWLCVFFVSDRVRLLCYSLLAVGSAGLMAIQIVMLKEFYYLCALHAIASWVALTTWKIPVRRWALPAAFVLVGTTFLGAQEQFTLAQQERDSRKAHSGGLRLTALVHDRSDGLSWFGAPTDNTSALVLSMNCPLCLDKMEELAALPPHVFTQNVHGPTLYFRTNKINRKLTVAMVSAVLSQPDKARDVFLAICHLFTVDKEAILTDPDFVAETLKKTFPDAEAHEQEAGALLGRQEIKLRKAGIRSTPFLIKNDGEGSTYFDLSEVFPAGGTHALTD